MTEYISLILAFIGGGATIATGAANGIPSSWTEHTS